jgi:hypothetical protein
MPFVTQKHRDNPDPLIPGDRCYVVYKELMDVWKASPRWTTVDTMTRQLLNFLEDIHVSAEHKTGALLAFLVFFNIHVMNYELKKREENGDYERK